MEGESLAYRKLEITLISATNLPNIRSTNLSRMKVYAMVRIGNIFETTKKTHPDTDGGTNPVWNYETEYFISDAGVQQATGLMVIIELYCERSILKNKFIGQVSISINELFNTRRDGTNRSFKLDNGINGVVNLSYRFGDLINGRVRHWKRNIMSVTRQLWRAGGKLLLETSIITAAEILVQAV